MIINRETSRKRRESAESEDPERESSAPKGDAPGDEPTDQESDYELSDEERVVPDPDGARRHGETKAA